VGLDDPAGHDGAAALAEEQHRVVRGRVGGDGPGPALSGVGWRHHRDEFGAGEGLGHGVGDSDRVGAGGVGLPKQNPSHLSEQRFATTVAKPYHRNRLTVRLVGASRMQPTYR